METTTLVVEVVVQVAPQYMEAVHLETGVLIEIMVALEHMLVQAEAAAEQMPLEADKVEVLEVLVLSEYFINEEVLYGL